MFKKASNTTLFGILAVLLLVYIGLTFWDNSGRSVSIRASLVNIDTTAVSRIVINKAGTETQLIKENGSWKIMLADGRKAEAMDSKVKGTIDQLLQIKPSRLASRSDKKWKEFQVDSAGTVIEVFEGDKQSLDIVVGRFGTKQPPNQGRQQMQFQQQQQNFKFFSYVRLSEDQETYVVDDFMGMYISSNPADYRNNTILKLNNPDSITAVRFNYIDSSFVLNNLGGVWQSDGNMLDSASIAGYKSAIRQLSSRNFVDDIDLSSLGSPAASVIIEGKDMTPIEVRAFPHPTHQWLLHASSNPNEVFAAPDVKSKLFISRSSLLKQEE